MIDIIIFIVSFISLFLGVFWISVLGIERRAKKQLRELPSVSVIVPAYNEECNIAETVEALANLDYPQEKLEIIVVNDDSTDRTGEIARSLTTRYKNLLVIDRKKDKGLRIKAPALNEGMRHAKGEFVACVDADTIVDRSSLISIIHNFADRDVAAAISIIKLREENTFWEKLQRIEYIFTSLMRELMAKIDVLHITPGALSVYRTDILKKLGGFDENNITEDLEMALRLCYHNHKIKMDHESIAYTKVPSTFGALWRQRVRWFRGFMYNHYRYRKMFMNKNYGLMGIFQFPINILTFVTMILLFFLLGYKIVARVYKIVVMSSVVKSDMLAFLKVPGFNQVLFGINAKITIAVAITLLLSLYLYHLAHRAVDEKWRFPVQTVIYFTLYPLLRSMQWVTAMVHELGKVKKKW